MDSKKFAVGQDYQLVRLNQLCASICVNVYTLDCFCRGTDAWNAMSCLMQRMQDTAVV